ncbi:MAG: hypothetical protein J5I91_00760 [Bacteroidetes bacterium]|nr:hypothetical protein [Bacteroidota bacterium]
MFGFGSKQKKVSFRYIPRFYDENKEDLRNRVRAIKEAIGEVDGQKPKPGSSIRGAFTSHKPKKSEKQIRLRNQNIRLILILIALAYLAWQITTSDFIQQLFDKFDPNTYE